MFGSAKRVLSSQCLITLTASLLCSACGTGIGARYETAQTIAAGAELIRHDLKGSAFVLASWRRINDPNAPVNLYIEGDGLAWISRSEPSLNPTPKTPLALILAAEDPAPNVIYIARPCQYNRADMPGNTACADSAYWRGKRFAAEVMHSYRQALDQIAARYTGGFHLIGYSGGANIAGLTAASRGDVLSLRTVAGNVDNDFFTKFHGVSDMPYSLNMADSKDELSSVPQLHFIGGHDKIIPMDIYESYARAPSSCVHSKIVAEASHEEGWAERWPELLTIPVRCE